MSSGASRALTRATAHSSQPGSSQNPSDRAVRRRLHRALAPSAPGLLVLAAIALVAAIGLALFASGWAIAGVFPLWDAALVVMSLTVLASVIGFPEWWRYGGRGRPAAKTTCDRRHRRGARRVLRDDGALLAADRRLLERPRRGSHGHRCTPPASTRWSSSVHRGDGRFEGLRTHRRSHERELGGSSRRARGRQH